MSAWCHVHTPGNGLVPSISWKKIKLKIVGPLLKDIKKTTLSLPKWERQAKGPILGLVERTLIRSVINQNLFQLGSAGNHIAV